MERDMETQKKESIFDAEPLLKEMRFGSNCVFPRPAKTAMAACHWQQRSQTEITPGWAAGSCFFGHETWWVYMGF